MKLDIGRKHLLDLANQLHVFMETVTIYKPNTELSRLIEKACRLEEITSPSQVLVPASAFKV